MYWQEQGSAREATWANCRSDRIVNSRGLRLRISELINRQVWVLIKTLRSGRHGSSQDLFEVTVLHVCWQLDFGVDGDGCSLLVPDAEHKSSHQSEVKDAFNKAANCSTDKDQPVNHHPSQPQFFNSFFCKPCNTSYYRDGNMGSTSSRRPLGCMVGWLSSTWNDSHAPSGSKPKVA